MDRFEDIVRQACIDVSGCDGERLELAYALLEMRMRNQAAQECAELHAVATCRECGRLYSREEWRALPISSTWRDEYSNEERRNCDTVIDGKRCGARLAVVTLVKRRYQPGAINTITAASQHLLCDACLLVIHPGDICVRRDCPLTPKPETFCLQCQPR